MTEAVLENPDLFDLTMSDEAQPLLDAVKKHIKENVDPITEEYHRLGEGRKEHWGYGDGQLELLETAKQKAKDSGLWNFFLPDADTGDGELRDRDRESRFRQPKTSRLGRCG